MQEMLRDRMLLHDSLKELSALNREYFSRNNRQGACETSVLGK